LHSGIASKSGRGYAHLDLKPWNIVVDDQGKLHIIDYGFSIEINLEIVHVSTYAYLPLHQGYWENEREGLRQMKRTGAHGVDIFALLRTLFHKFSGTVSLFDHDDYQKLPADLQAILDTDDVEKFIQGNKHTAISLASRF
jgi:serine/threonine protein kinase